MDQLRQPLRILMIVNLPWDARLGAVRVWMELAEQWRAMGHVVEKFSLSDAFPGVRAQRVTFALRQIAFVRKAAAFVKKNGTRFDIIDALIGTLPFTKEELGFRGLIVARSVGLYLLYDRFERNLGQRFRGSARGKFLGRILYRFTRSRLAQVSGKAVRAADLINLPNEEEASVLRVELGAKRRIIVQPYGLTTKRREALRTAALAPELRLAQKRICFIGMWGARKGAHDWPRIIERVRTEIPEARFRFLGTMVEATAIQNDLALSQTEGIEFISDYQPDELPSLLADCTVGAFPSYVEGFGMAVIEQLAAGLPTIAYETAGPRDILAGSLPEFLVPSGDVEALAAAICRVPRLDRERYFELSKRCTETAARFSWTNIARDTIGEYERVLKKSEAPIVFVQPFSLGSAGGGARILRALLEKAPFVWRSVCSSPAKPKWWRDEFHLPARPSWGRLEHTRLAALPNASARFFRRRFRRRLKKYCERLGARAIHAVPHAGLDFADVHTVARDLNLPFFISLHDDLSYTAAGAVRPGKREAAVAAAWTEAAGRFVISDALGQEYCRRYGEQVYEVVTDGLNTLNPLRAPGNGRVLRIYFMGLFHMSYERNLRALLDGAVLLEREHPGVSVQITLRCEHVRPQVIAGKNGVTVLPFSDEEQVQRDIENADLLYMPIPFGDEHGNFARYSLSTKMVTYLGSGVPILYHGPSTSAAFDLLQKNEAAIPLTTLIPEEIAAALNESDAGIRDRVAANALALAERDFMLADQARKFWGRIGNVLTIE